MTRPCTSGVWRWMVLVLIATTGSVTGQVCPKVGYASFNGVCYKNFPELKTYDEARQTCAADGGLLAMPKDNATNTFIHGLAGGGRRWIGLTDIDNEGQWVFEDGETLASSSFTNWHPDEPNNEHGYEHCAEVLGSTHGWNDLPCSFQNGFICQLDNTQWLEVFSTVKGTGQTVYDAWSAASNAGVRHIRCPVVEHWESLNIQRVRVVLESNSSANAELIFNGTNTDKFNWFSKSRLLSSPWHDINTEPQNYFSIVGTTFYQRSFYINRNWGPGGCLGDDGWLMVADSGPDGVCSWEQAPDNQLPKIIFSNNGYVTNWENGINVGEAERMVIYIDTPGNVLCSCPAGQSFSEDGTSCVACSIAGYVHFNGVCYKDFAELKTYDEAEQTCAADGGLLAMPKDNAINTFIHELAEAELRWIGLTDTESEGQWVFADGQTLASTGYSNWYPGEPNDINGGEDCAVVNFRSTDEWNDEHCSLPKGFICQLVCTEDHKATCIAWGDPHFDTFDGTKFDFQGPFRYTFAKDCGNSKDFTVEVQQVPSPWNPTVSIVREVYVMAYGYEIGILQRQVVTVKGQPPMVTVTTTPPFSLAMGRIQVTLSGRFVRVELTVLCVVILYDGEETVEVKIPRNYQNMMCGLCGNYNSMGAEDLVLPNGSIASNVNEFGNSWETDNNTSFGDRPTGEPPTQGPCDPNYSDPCRVLTDPNGQFAACHGVVDPQNYFQSCVYDTCATQGRGLCSGLGVYYASCRDAGVPPFTWRTPQLCPLNCPANSTYSSCTTACPATCVNPSAPDNCTLPCVEGCACDAGYLLSGLDCVPQADCGCTDRDGYYHALGAVWEESGDKCECREGNAIFCKACTENATCTAWGDPHFMTFNRKYYDFQGPCRYTFAKDCGNSSDFNIEVQHVPTTPNPFVSTVHEVYVMAYGYEIEIRQGNGVTVKAPLANNAILATPPLSQAMGKIQVTLSGIYVRVELTELCVVILYDGNHENRVQVTIPGHYRNMMCGLCGNYNGFGTDDFEMPNGNIASNVEEFGNSWETDSNTCYARRGKRQTQDECDPIHSDPCKVLTDPNGPFAACHGAVDPQVHFESCVFDECATQGQGEFLCANLGAYYASCRDAGVPSFTWRTSELCPLECPANSMYSSCATACPATCANPSAPDSCNLPCVEGCECDAGYVQSGPDCVPQADCGCSSNNGYYHTLGAVWEDNGEECVCHAGNTIVCEEIDGCDPNPCVANAECTDVPAPGTGATCTCGAEYQGDGQIDGTGCTVLSDLTLDDAGISHLSVSWTVLGNLPISRYRLRYLRAGGSYQDLSPAPVAGATSATVSGLLADTEYTLTLTSFDVDDQPNGVFSGTYTTDSVVVNVECDQDSMRLSIPRAALLAVNVEDLHLLDPDCGATEDEVEDVFKLETHLQECGTRQETSGDDKLIFSNEVIANQVTYDNGAVRNQPVNLPFQCEFIRQHVVSQGGDILYNIPSPRVQIVDANNSFIIEMRMYTSGDFSASYESSDFPIQVLPSDRLNFGLSVASPLDNLELFARDCVSTPTTNPDDSPRVSIIDDGCQVDQTLQKDNDLSNDKALYYSVAAFTFPNAIDPSLVYFHCTMIICFKDDPDSRCKQGCIPPAGRRRRSVSDGTESRVRRERGRDKQADITQGPFQVLFEEESGTGPAGVPLGTAIGASVGVAGVMVLLIVVVVLVKKRRGLALGRKKRDDDTVGLDNYAFQTWGKMSKTGIADTKA